MIKPSITPADLVACLNELLLLDHDAVAAVLRTAHPCGAALAEHPTCQVYPEPHRVSALGMLNGLFGTYGPEAGRLAGSGCIAAEVEDDGAITRFVVLAPEEVAR